MEKSLIDVMVRGKKKMTVLIVKPLAETLAKAASTMMPTSMAETLPKMLA